MLIDVDINDHIEELETDVLIFELEDRGCFIYDVEQKDKEENNFIHQENFKDKIKNRLYDLFNVGYHTDSEIILKKLKNLIG